MIREMLFMLLAKSKRFFTSLFHPGVLLLLRFRHLCYGLAYVGIFPKRWRKVLLARFWESKADTIHFAWGDADDDFGTLADILRRYHPTTLLDFGCGSGRLFGLYRDCGITQVTGIDMSSRALEIARSRFPETTLFQCSLEGFEFPIEGYDLIVCNRVLQHMPQESIELVINKLTHGSHFTYVNELTGSDDLNEAFYMRRYDYHCLFKSCGAECIETGQIGKQTYFVFGTNMEEH